MLKTFVYRVWRYESETVEIDADMKADADLILKGKIDRGDVNADGGHDLIEIRERLQPVPRTKLKKEA